jgi:LuxR family transcriptional regulator, maltose regulon positive regulatory protein
VVARPGLTGRLGGPARVTVVSAPPGSGKTVLLRCWAGQAGLDGRIAWVSAGWENREPPRFWLSAAGALRATVPGAGLVQPLTAAPDLDGWMIAERLLKDLAPLDEPVWLVIDDVHELGPQALRQLELLIMRAPPRLRYVLATRHDLRLGLHRLRLEGELAEIRADDLRFSTDDAGQLFAAAGVRLPASAVALLVDRTEGWAAGLRLAALSLAGHPDPEQFAAGFSGTDRTVAEYLLAEVLERQPEPVRRLLLRTSILQRVNGELADLLTGDTGAEAALQDLEKANAFVVSLDPQRSWFRYHQMFAALLQLELRRTDPAEVTALHQTAAGWLAQHGYPVEAIRHAQAARDWDQAARLLADHWPSLYLDGQSATTRQLLAQFPPAALAADAELAAVAAADELAHGSLETAGLYLGLAEQKAAAVPARRQGQLRLLLGLVGLLLARQRVDLSAVAEEARRLQATAETRDAAQPCLGEDLRALALISLGTTEYWTARFEDADRHLEHGVTLARMIGRPFLEFSGLAYQAAAGMYRSFALATERSMQAFELARSHGWTDEPAAGTACMVLGAVLAWQGRQEEAEPWVQRAERTLSADAEPAAGMGVRYVRGLLELARGRDSDALAALRAAELLAGRLAMPHYLVPRTRALLLHALVRLGEAESAEQFLANLREQDLEAGEIRLAIAALRLAQHDPRAATVALAPVLDGSAPLGRGFPCHAFILEAIARDALGDSDSAESALERALDLAEPNGTVLPFLRNPVPVLLARLSGHRSAHASLIADIQSLVAKSRSARSADGPQPLPEPLRESETRVLRYLPTNLTAPEIASELYISPNTVKTHIRNLYVKLGATRRAEAVDRARELGLLAPSSHADLSGLRIRRTGLPSPGTRARRTGALGRPSGTAD